MKNLSKVLSVLVLALALLFGTQLNAQSGISTSTTPVCTASTVVGSACVGSCSQVGVINYDVGPICSSATVGFCVETVSSNLCPSHIAIASVYVNGVLTKRGKISNTDASFSFKAPCGSHIEIIAVTRHVDPTINCVQFGEVHFELKK